MSRFGVPTDLTVDRGAQFTSTMWKELNLLLGIKLFPTTSYHPQANGLIERFHRHLKASLMTVTSGDLRGDQIFKPHPPIWSLVSLSGFLETW